jgi:hypothetical protein
VIGLDYGPGSPIVGARQRRGDQMRKATRSDYRHFESCWGNLTGGSGPSTQTYSIGDFFWNKDESADGRFSIRLHGDDIAFRAPLRLRAGLAEARFRDFAKSPRAWQIACRCGAVTLKATGVMVIDYKIDTFPNLAYVSFRPGLETEAPAFDEWGRR